MHKQTDLIIDGNSLFARSWYVFAKEAKGPSPISVESVFFRTIFAMLGGKLADVPTRVLVCWDNKAKTDKGRGPKPEGYHAAIDRIMKLCPLILGASIAHIGEADDSCAAAAYRSEREGNLAILASTDKDLMQCIGPGIKVYSFSEKGIVGAEHIRNKWGVASPIHLAIYLAIVGDKIDGVNGLPKYGKVKALALLEDVPARAKLGEAYALVRKKLPSETLREIFDEELSKVLLDAEMDGVPDPAPLHLCDSDFLSDHGMGDILGYYFQASNKVEDIDPEDFDLDG